MNKRQFRSIAIVVVCSLVTLAVMQTLWSSQMYSSLKGALLDKAGSALGKSVLQETIKRNFDTSHNNDSNKSGSSLETASSQTSETITTSKTGLKVDSIPSLSTIPASSIKAISIHKQNLNSSTDTMNLHLNIKTNYNTERKSDKSKKVNGNGSEKIEMKYTINVTVKSTLDFKSIDVGVLDSLLEKNLKEVGITGLHNLKIKNTKNGESLSKTNNIIRDPLIITYKNDDLHAEYMAEIENPFYSIRGKIRGVIFSSLFIVILIALSFAYLLRTLFKQKEIEEMRRDFSHNMTHELKTPLAVAYTANDAMINFSAGNDPQKRNEYLNIVKKQLDNLSLMVEKILSISIEENPDFSLNTTTFYLKPELEKLADLNQRGAGKEVFISINVNPETLQIKVDKFHLLNVIGNLIDNAIKYSGESVKISIDASVSEEHLHNSTKRIVKISLSDNGIGMSSEQQKHIFEKFYRIPTGDIQEVRGYGLGLFYAKEIIEKHGGKLTVESKKGEGSKFSIYLKYRV